MNAAQIALTCTHSEDTHGALHWLLSDFVEAMLAYSQLAAQTIKGSQMPIPEMRVFNWIGEPPAHTTDTPTLQTCDCLVIGCNYHDTFNTAMQHLLSCFEQLPSQAGIYGICSVEGPDPTLATPSLAALAQAAQAHWMGGVAVSGAELTSFLSHQPRMGILRRPISETLDTCIAAVRTHTALHGKDASNLLYTHPGIPKPLWKIARQRLGSY